MGRRLFGVLFVSVLLLAFSSPLYAAPKLQLLLTVSHANPILAHSLVVVTIEAKDKQGYDFPLHLSDVTATWNQEVVNVIPADMNLPPQVASLVPVGQITPEGLKELRKEVPVLADYLTDSAIDEVFKNPHEKFMICKEDVPAGEDQVSATASIPSGTISNGTTVEVVDPLASTTSLSATPLYQSTGSDVNMTVVLSSSSSDATVVNGLLNVNVGDQVTLTGTLSNPVKFTGVTVGIHTPVCGPPQNLFGSTYYEQCSAVVGASGQGGPAPSTGPESANFFAPFPPGYFTGGGFSITVQILPPEIPGASEAGIYAGAMATRNKNNYLDEVFAYYRIAPPGSKIQLSLSPNPVYPSNLWTLQGPVLHGLMLSDQTTAVTVVVRGLSNGQSTSITLSSQPVEDSGGHDHDTTRPSGSFYLDSNATELIGATAVKTLTGDEQGSAQQFTVYYKPSAFGGVERLTATDGTISSSADLTVSVPSLEDFASVPNNGEWVLDGNTGTTTVNECYGKTILHPSNHWITPTAAGILIDVFNQFTEASPGTIIHVNDMSLQDGGLFDICSDWQNPHFYHRNGTSVDLDDIYSSQQLEVLTEIMNAHQFFRYPEEPLHYEFLP